MSSVYELGMDIIERQLKSSVSRHGVSGLGLGVFTSLRGLL